MTNAIVSPSHGAFFKRKRRQFPVVAVVPAPASITTPPPLTIPTIPTTATAQDESTVEPDSPRPSTAISLVSQAESSLTPLSQAVTDPHPARSASTRSPTKGRSAYAQFSEAFAARWESRSTNSPTTRQFPPSAFAHRSKHSESAASDLYAKDLTTSSRNASFEASDTASGPTSPLFSRRASSTRLPATAFGISSGEGHGITRSMTIGHTATAGGQSSAQALFQHIHNVATKRISTLDYLRQVHEGNVYWFTTFQFSRSDFSKLPYFEPRKLARRATNYLLLGISLPTVLDPNSDTAAEYLRAFNAILGEFETYSTLHSVDGNLSGSIGKSRIPQLFRRATGQAGAKARRTSNPVDVGGYESGDLRSGASHGSTPSASFSSITSDHELLPGEEYNFLLTPSLPFEPDYFETFITLCDVLTDCYTRIMTLVNSPEAVQSGIGDLFSKADGKVRKLLMTGLVQELSEATKQGVRAELAGVGKVILGPLMG